MAETLFIINPTAARGTTLHKWGEAKRELLQLGIQASERVTTRPGEATQLTREAIKQGVVRIVAVGGDGTLNEVINGYLDGAGQPLNGSVAIGLLPSGTGSDFRRSIGLTRREQPLWALMRQDTRWIDAGFAEFKDVNGARCSRFFINVATFGLGGDTSARVNAWRGKLPKWIGGRVRFLAAAISALRKYRNVSTQVLLDDGRKYDIASNLMVVANGRFAGGGMMLAPNAALDDGLFDIVLANDATRLDVICELPRIQRGGYIHHPK
ncbi:MAG TPA: diacylglycerol kinase family protein, partial [Blastocatellia bacterium]|nr:diacylglycerol kinase family protein [Blastocatellia bacterium]